ncbi:MAG: hypothetical protein ABEL76_02225, partial [Bradymonadaceae bacterium]
GQRGVPVTIVRDDEGDEGEGSGGTQLFAGGGGESDDGPSDDEGASGSSGSALWAGGDDSEDDRATLTVRVSKGWGKVYVDGRLVSEETPMNGHSIRPGRHEVKV